MEIKILGSHCPRCNTLHRLVKRAIEELSLDAEVKFVDDPIEIAKVTYVTPTLVIDERVILRGKVPTYPEVKKIILSAKR